VTAAGAPGGGGSKSTAAAQRSQQGTEKWEVRETQAHAWSAAKRRAWGEGGEGEG
jgi:hypothetical protein